MKHLLIIAGFFYCSFSSIAQKSYHGMYVGSGLLSYQPNGSFIDAQLGFSAGYRYYLPISPTIKLNVGLNYQQVSSSFDRLYQDPFICAPCILPVTYLYEDINLHRLSLPVSMMYTFIQNKKNDWYVTIGIEAIFLNRINRIVDYSFPSSPSVFGTYKGKQNIKFGNTSPIGFSFSGGLGTNFEIKEKDFFAEVSFSTDLSRNSFNKLTNIERSGNFYTKMIGFQLKFGHTFSFERTGK